MTDEAQTAADIQEWQKRRSFKNFFLSRRLQVIYGFLFPTFVGLTYFSCGLAASGFLLWREGAPVGGGAIAWFVLGVALLLAFTFAWGTLITFFLAGPLYAVKRHLEKVASGESPPPLKFRGYDEFKGLDELVNRSLDEARRQGSRAQADAVSERKNS